MIIEVVRAEPKIKLEMTPGELIEMRDIYIHHNRYHSKDITPGILEKLDAAVNKL